MIEVQLLRIDDRLIHGQVLIGWARYLKSNRILLCDDDIVKNNWEKELYLSCVSSDFEAIVFNVRETAAYLLNQLQTNDKTIVLIKSPQVLLSLTEMGYIPSSVNLGGMHYTENRRKYLPYLFLSIEEIDCIKRLHDSGIFIYCQDLPTSKKYDVMEVISK